MAKDQFFGGRLLAEATVGRAVNRQGPGRRGGRAPGGGDRGESRGRRGGSGPGMGPGGGGAPEMGGNSDGPSINLREAGFPPVALQVRLTNKSDETVEVTFLRCKSALGDFAVRPEKLALAPEQSAEPDRMTSHLGLTTAALELTLELKLGDKAETKVLVLTPEASSEAQSGAPSVTPR